MPDQIRVEVDTTTNTITTATKDLPNLASPDVIIQLGELQLTNDDAQQQKLQSKLSPDTSLAPLELELEVARTTGMPPLPTPFERSINGHTSVRAGFYFGYGDSLYHPGQANEEIASGSNNGFHFELGRQQHMLNKWNLPRLNLNLGIGANFEWQNRDLSFDRGSYRQSGMLLEFPASIALTVGDPWGLIEIGPMAQLGVSMRAYDQAPFSGHQLQLYPSLLLGAGAHIGIGENIVWLEAVHQWNINPLQETGSESKVMFGVDILTWLRALNLIKKNI